MFSIPLTQRPLLAPIRFGTTSRLNPTIVGRGSVANTDGNTEFEILLQGARTALQQVSQALCTEGPNFSCFTVVRQDLRDRTYRLKRALESAIAAYELNPAHMGNQGRLFDVYMEAQDYIRNMPIVAAYPVGRPPQPPREIDTSVPGNESDGEDPGAGDDIYD